MMAAAPGDDAPCALQPGRYRLPVLMGALEVLPYAAEQKDVVVHRRVRRGCRKGRSGTQDSIEVRLLEAEQAMPQALLEDHDQDAVGGPQGEQVHEDGFERHNERAEGEQEEDEAEPQHEREDPRGIVADESHRIGVGRRARP